MADPGAVKVIADAIGTTTADTRNAISAALDSGFNGPTILALYNQGNRDLSGGGVIWTAVRSKISSENQQKQQAADEAARVKVGLSAAPPSRLDTSAAAGKAQPPENSEFEDQVAQLVLAGFPEAQAREIARQAILKSLNLNSSGSIGGTGQAPVARYSFQTIGRTLYRANDLTGSLEPALGPNGTPITVPSELTGIQTDRNGDLVGYDPETKKTVVIQKGFSFPQADPNVKTVVDAKTGTSYAVNVQTGDRREIGTYDFPQISPQEKATEEKRQFDTSESRLNRSLDITQENNNRTNSRLETDTIREILSNPTDFLARAYLSRGGDPATAGAPITQADLLNNLRSAIQQGAGATSRVAPGASAPPVNTALDRQVASFGAPPVAPQAPAPAIAPAIAPPPQPVAAPSRLTPNPSLAGDDLQALINGDPAAISRLNSAGFTQEGVPLPAQPAQDTGHQAWWQNPAQTIGFPNSLYETLYYDRLKGGNAWLTTNYSPEERAQFDAFFQSKNPMPNPTLNVGSAGGSSIGPLGANNAISRLAVPDTQQSIRDLARSNSPIAVNALLGAGTEGLSMTSPVPISSPRQTSRLTGDETAALGTRLAAEGTSLGDYGAQQGQLFGVKRSSHRARLVI